MIAATQLPVNGFLAAGAPFAAEVSFIVQLALGGALIAGLILAKKKRYRAHSACQNDSSAAQLGNDWVRDVASFRLQIAPRLPRVFHPAYYTIATVRAALGTVAELLGIYIVLVAGTKLVPPSLRFTHWKRWMRIELAVWLLVLAPALGVTTNGTWYRSDEQRTNFALTKRPAHPLLGYSTEVANPEPLSWPVAAELICSIPRMTISGRSIMTACPLSRAMILRLREESAFSRSCKEFQIGRINAG